MFVSTFVTARLHSVRASTVQAFLSATALRRVRRFERRQSKGEEVRAPSSSSSSSSSLLAVSVLVLARATF